MIKFKKPVLPPQWVESTDFTVGLYDIARDSLCNLGIKPRITTKLFNNLDGSLVLQWKIKDRGDLRYFYSDEEIPASVRTLIRMMASSIYDIGHIYLFRDPDLSDDERAFYVRFKKDEDPVDLMIITN